MPTEGSSSHRKSHLSGFCMCPLRTAPFRVSTQEKWDQPSGPIYRIQLQKITQKTILTWTMEVWSSSRFLTGLPVRFRLLGSHRDFLTCKGLLGSWPISSTDVEFRINKVPGWLKIIYPPLHPPCILPQVPATPIEFYTWNLWGKITKVKLNSQATSVFWIFTSFFFESEKTQSHPHSRFQWDFIPAACWDENRLLWIWLELGSSVIKSKSAQRHLWHLELVSVTVTYSEIGPQSKVNRLGTNLNNYPLERGIKTECFGVLRHLNYTKPENSAVLDVEIIED